MKNTFDTQNTTDIFFLELNLKQDIYILHVTIILCLIRHMYAIKFFIIRYFINFKAKNCYFVTKKCSPN